MLGPLLVQFVSYYQIRYMYITPVAHNTKEMFSPLALVVCVHYISSAISVVNV